MGFEAYWGHHLSRYSLDFVEISANTRSGNHIEPHSERCSYGQTVGMVAGVSTDCGQIVERQIVEDDAVMGGIALRCGDESFTRVVGHVGYGIRPSARRRGLATWALSRMPNHARDLDLGSILLVCEANNAESAATIERTSGVLDAIEDTDYGPMRRYWIRPK